MTAFRHPSDQTLMRLAAGNLGAGPRLVVSIHLESCPHCRDRVKLFEAMGGALLENLPPAPVSSSQLERIFLTIDAGPVPPERRRWRKQAPVLPNGFALPAALAGSEIGPWRFINPNLRWARVRLADAPDERVVLLKIAAGHKAPAHAHRGLELTQVLYGRFSDSRGLYGPGDLIEADEELCDHEPRVTDGGECLCIAAVEQPLLINSLMGRMFQPLMGI
ncbi:ChrR family anti-sigma-E factor [uncultured Rhodoblastus sp.]|uniref:ChrR family anti-sigma-E factor n=1 Tax=uncultured Rhodoblastus sp. TaxID=543037 RepID=UPI0025DC6602|nr:ChrR family anti-sigma-E factor [uncultured Rhodoblastus sp.]